MDVRGSYWRAGAGRLQDNPAAGDRGDYRAARNHRRIDDRNDDEYRHLPARVDRAKFVAEVFLLVQLDQHGFERCAAGFEQRVRNEGTGAGAEVQLHGVSLGFSGRL